MSFFTCIGIQTLVKHAAGNYNFKSFALAFGMADISLQVVWLVGMFLLYRRELRIYKLYFRDNRSVGKGIRPPRRFTPGTNSNANLQENPTLGVKRVTLPGRSIEQIGEEENVL